MREFEKELLAEQMRMNNSCSVRVGGFCMAPAIRNHAEVTLEPVADPSCLRPGDILAYFIDTQLFVHRIVEKKGALLRMNGDNIAAQPHEIGVDAVFGRVKTVKNPGVFSRILRKTGEFYARLIARKA